MFMELRGCSLLGMIWTQVNDCWRQRVVATSSLNTLQVRTGINPTFFICSQNIVAPFLYTKIKTIHINRIPINITTKPLYADIFFFTIYTADHIKIQFCKSMFYVYTCTMYIYSKWTILEIRRKWMFPV